MDLTEMEFGDLIAKRRVSKRKWECECSCGKHVNVDCYHLLDGHTQSCGHTRKDNFKYITHNQSKTRLYQCYHSMIKRCKTDEHYIKNNTSVCNEWLEDFENFKYWAENNGYNDNLTLERKNVYGNYCPENCEWITKSKQTQNKTTTIYLTYQNETKKLSEWALQLGVSRQTLYQRYWRGMSVEKILKELFIKDKEENIDE